MDENKLIEIFEKSTSLKEVCVELYGKYNENTRRKLKIIFNKLNYNWDKHIDNIKKIKLQYCLNCGKELKRRTI